MNLNDAVTISNQRIQIAILFIIMSFSVLVFVEGSNLSIAPENADTEGADDLATSATSATSALKNLDVSADGPISTLQNDGNNTWITWGKWKLLSNSFQSTQNTSSPISFNATITTVKTDNSDGHKHEIFGFKLLGVSATTELASTILVFNGTATINTKVGEYPSVPVSIRIIDSGQMTASIDTQTDYIKPSWFPKGGTIAISINDKQFHDHFGNTPIYGTVKKK